MGIKQGMPVMDQGKIFFWVILMFWLAGTIDAFASQSFSGRPDAFSVDRILDMRSGKNLKGFEIKNATVKPSQTLCSLLKPYSITDALIYEIAAESKDVFDVRQIKAGNTYSVVFDPSHNNQARYLIYDPTPETYVLFDFFGSTRVYAGQKSIEIEFKVAEGDIQGSLWESLQPYPHHADLIQKLTRIFSASIDFNRMGKNDSFKIMYDEKHIHGRSIGIKGIQAAALAVNGQIHQAFYYCCDEEKEGFYDENGYSLEKAFLKSPLKYTRMTSGYKAKRLHPITNKYVAHPGIDYAAPTGTPVNAVADGIVIFRGYSPSAGHYIKIQHSPRQITEYLHLSRFDKSLKVNKPVKKGDVIGFVGQTGLATGPHLDFRFMEDGQYLDYTKLTFPSADPLDGIHQKRFKKQVELVSMLYEMAVQSSAHARNDMTESTQPFDGNRSL